MLPPPSADDAAASQPPPPPTTTTTTGTTTPASTSSDVDADTETGLVLDFTPKFSTLQSGERAVSLEWRDIEYKVNVGSRKEKTIIKTISGQANPGEVCALMGPSGSGKSTLLNILAGRITGERWGRSLTGTFLANGEVVKPSAFRKRVAYVMQEDALFATATARESLEFSARLRLPAAVTADQRRALVDDMLDSLGLTKVQHTMVGSDLIRGLSGGEKKRTAIGVELVSSPDVLFLDEPTSGLDSYSAWKVVRVLNALAGRDGSTGKITGRAKCTIVCSIHQPSSEVFREFSHLILLGQGHVVFQGAIQDVPGAFKSARMGVPPNTNIADHVMLCVQTKPFETLPNDDKNERAPRAKFAPGHDDVERGGQNKMGGRLSSVFSRVGSTVGLDKVGSVIKGATEAQSEVTRVADRAPWYVQVGMLARREIRGLGRDIGGLFGRFGGTAILNILFAIIFLGAADQSKSNYSTQTHFGALVQIVISALFGAAQPALLTFPLEKVIFLRERGTSTYYTTSYMLAKLTVDVIVDYLTAIVTLLVSYWTIGFRGSFFYWSIWLFLLMEAAASTALLIGSIASNAKAALELAPLVLVPQILFLGLFIRLDQIPAFLSWAQYLVAAKYAVNLATLNEFNPVLCTKPEICVEWAQLLDFNDIKFDLFGFYVGLLIVLFVGFRFVALGTLSWKASRFES